MNIWCILKDVLRSEQKVRAWKHKRHSRKIDQSCCSLPIKPWTHFEIFLWTPVRTMLRENGHQKLCYHVSWIGLLDGFIFLPSDPLHSSNCPLGSHEPSVKHLTIGLEKMTQGSSFKCQLSPPQQKQTYPQGLDLKTYLYFICLLS